MIIAIEQKPVPVTFMKSPALCNLFLFCLMHLVIARLFSSNPFALCELRIAYVRTYFILRRINPSNLLALVFFSSKSFSSPSALVSLWWCLRYAIYVGAGVRARHHENFISYKSNIFVICAKFQGRIFIILSRRVQCFIIQVDFCTFTTMRWQWKGNNFYTDRQMSQRSSSAGTAP